MSRNIDFSKVNWGPDDARGDHNLNSYFVEVANYEGLIDGSKRLVIGRKGTGKTAICEHLRLTAASTHSSFESSFSLRNFPLSYVRDLRDKSLRDKSQFVPVWSFLLALELSRLVLEDNSAGPLEVVDELSRFLKMNFPKDAVGLTETLTHLRRRESKIAILSQWIGKEQSSGSAFETVGGVHFHQVTSTLVEKLCKIHSESLFYILLDELDEGYHAGDKSLRLLLLSLLRAASDLFVKTKDSGLKVRPITVLRSDIFDELDDNDLNKYHDYIIRLHWTGRPNSQFSLRKIVNARILASGLDVDSEDPWLSCVDGTNSTATKLWWYLVHRTHQRPRDIIKFLKLCGTRCRQTSLHAEAIYDAEREYSDWLYHEIGNEVHSILSPWREAMLCISQLGEIFPRTGALRKKLGENPEIKSWISETGKSPDHVLSALYRVSAIGHMNRAGRFIFRYQDESIDDWDPDGKLFIHQGLHKKLRLRTVGKESLQIQATQSAIEGSQG